MSFDLKLVNGNLSIKNGSLEKVTGTNKLIQDILKIALTDIGSNSLNPFYGSYLSKSMIGSALDPEVTADVAKEQLTLAIETLKKLQQGQLNQLENVTADEQIAAILDVSVNQNKIDPRLFDISIKVLTKALNKVANISFPLKAF